MQQDKIYDTGCILSVLSQLYPDDVVIYESGNLFYKRVKNIQEEFPESILANAEVIRFERKGVEMYNISLADWPTISSEEKFGWYDEVVLIKNEKTMYLEKFVR